MANKIFDMFGKALSLNNLPSGNGNRGGWFNVIKEPFTGAWQRNQEMSREDILGYHAIYACITLIANDISKLPLRLVRKDSNGIWTEFDSPAYSPVIRKPNKFQTRIQFFENWVLSILANGNCYVLKVRDNRNVVVGLYILDPAKVQTLVSDSGDVFYELHPDNVSNIQEPITVPASEIIHDRMNPLYHPLVGISPIYACALPVLQATEIQRNSAEFFRNNARPGGILTAPGAVSDETVEQLRAYWESNYTGNNAGKVAVLADGLKYESFQVATAQSSQVIEQLKWSAEVVCSVFHVPPYKIGVGAAPNGGNIESENIRYYSEALQNRMESMEILLDEGLNTGPDVGVEFDVGNLLRMDSKSKIEAEELGTKSGIKKLNEARKNLNLPPMIGGETAYLQQQNFSVEALAKRDAKEDPFATGTTAAQPANDNPENEDDDISERFVTELRIKAAERFRNA